MMEKELGKKPQFTPDKTADTERNEPKKTNKTWEAFGRSKGCFIINDPKFLL